MDRGKAEYIQGLLRSKKLKDGNAFDFVKLRYDSVTDTYEVIAYKRYLNRFARNYLDAISTLNEVDWTVRPNENKLQVTIFSPQNTEVRMAYNEKLGYDEFRPPEHIRQEYYAADVLPPDEAVASYERGMQIAAEKGPDYHAGNFRRGQDNT